MADVQKALAKAEELQKAAAQIAGYPQSPKHSQLKTEGQAAEPSDRSTDVDQVAGTHTAGPGKKKKGKKDAEKGRAAQIADLAKAAAALAEAEDDDDATPDGEGAEDTSAEAAAEETAEETAEAPAEDATEPEAEAEAEVARSLRGHPDVQKTVDVSGWVRGITDQLDAALNTFDATLAKSLEASAIQTQAIAALAAQLADENAELHEIVKGFSERIERLERQPQDRKGITKSGVGVQLPGGAPTREQVLGRMTALAEKGMLSAMDIASFEATGQFTMRARELIERGGVQ